MSAERTKKAKKVLSEIPRILAENAFLAFLGMLLMSLFLAGILFYKYSVSVEKAELKAVDQSVGFKMEAYNEVLRVWQEREKRFREAGSKDYSNPFK